MRGEKTNESGVLKNHLAELKRDFPLLKLINGDAIYATRPLAEVLLDHNCDYLLQIKGNQPDIQEALEVCLGTAHEKQPATTTVLRIFRTDLDEPLRAQAENNRVGAGPRASNTLTLVNLQVARSQSQRQFACCLLLAACLAR
ncbi:hypothetical protein ETAA8_21570 [Anatilimnocola aggregata]|uniref:Transposase n=2 Tax=Anatilimnocola aggregata TaxID=2528021 RepID=A0A517YA05_9BACT|nr:hypothetical protein ETAA8_21570 [Anatilimnocola aggregata]